MATVTRRDLARALKEEYGGTIITEHDQWIQAFVDIVSRGISDSCRVEIRRFGSFNLTTIKAHTTVNPGKPVKEGEEREVLKIPQTYAVDFRTSRIFKERLKKDHAPKEEAQTEGSQEVSDSLAEEPGKEPLRGEIMDVNGVAEYLGLAPSTIYDKVRDMEMPHTRLGNLIGFENPTSISGSAKTPSDLTPASTKSGLRPPRTDPNPHSSFRMYPVHALRANRHL